MDEIKKEDLITNVHAINARCINPAVVLSTLCREVDTLEDLFVVAVHKEGDSTVYSTGDLKLLAYAAQVLEVTAHRYVRGEIISEE